MPKRSEKQSDVGGFEPRSLGTTSWRCSHVTQASQQSKVPNLTKPKVPDLAAGFRASSSRRRWWRGGRCTATRCWSRPSPCCRAAVKSWHCSPGKCPGRPTLTSVKETHLRLRIENSSVNKRASLAQWFHKSFKPISTGSNPGVGFILLPPVFPYRAFKIQSCSLQVVMLNLFLSRKLNSNDIAS